MSSTFNTYNIATTGMYVNQAGLTAVGNNLANVNTAGYSRQQMVSAEKVIDGPNGTSYGSGAGVAEIYRARSRFLDDAYRQVNGRNEYYNAQNALLEDAQKLLNEYSVRYGNGLQKILNDFFNSWNQLAKDPSSRATRQTVTESAGTLADVFSQIDLQLAQMQQDAGSRATDGVDRLNALAVQVADLNRRLAGTETGGNENGNLRDRRDALLDEMSALAAITVSEQGNGAVLVSLGGVSLVDRSAVHTITYEEIGTAIKVKWANGGKAELAEGIINGNREEADQTGSVLAKLRQGLNELLSTIATGVNSLLESGKDLSGNPGTDLFVKSNGNGPLAAGNIRVNPAITADVNKIAAGASGAADDAIVAAKIGELQKEKVFHYDGLALSATGYYQALVSWLATTGETAGGNCDTQGTLLRQVRNQRDGLSSVSLDEEMSKMIMYQNAYSASARVLSTVDKLLGDVIERMGR
jgi:flagellar hook-associated protein 1 FlgK